MTDKIEGSPSQHKQFRVRRARAEAIFSLRSIRSKMPLGMCGADVAIGVMSFTTVGRSCGPRAEPRRVDCYRASTAVATNSHSIFVICCPDIGMG
jgi:hypothetical protein